MTYLAALAVAQGSAELEYTDVHGVCDVAHTQELFRALAAEMALNRQERGEDLFEGVDLLRALMETIVLGPGCKKDIGAYTRWTARAAV